MLAVEGLRKEFSDVVAVDDLSFHIDPGVICGFVGPNGAGKTTTMRIISTLEMPTRGRIWVEGNSIFREPYKVRRRIGFMPDHLGIYPDLLVTDYLEFYAQAYDVDREVRAARLRDILEFTELNRVENKRVETLSKGWRQRLNLGRALVHDPGLLVLDEPAAGLDPRARVELRLLIRALAARGKTVFISSHILTELAEICDEMIIIDHGRAVLQGKSQEIRRRARETGHIVHIHLLDNSQAERIEPFLLSQMHVEGVTWRPDATLAVDFAGDHAAASELLSALVAEGFRVLEYRLETPTMEDVFMQLTTGEV